VPAIDGSVTAVSVVVLPLDFLPLEPTKTEVNCAIKAEQFLSFANLNIVNAIR